MTWLNETKSVLCYLLIPIGSLSHGKDQSQAVSAGGITHLALSQKNSGHTEQLPLTHREILPVFHHLRLQL